MIKLYTILFITLFASVTALAQSTLTGKVYDADGEPLVGATVQISSLKKGDITDADGHYSIESLPQKTLQVQATSVGYKVETKTVTLSRKTTLNFTLNAQSVKHGEILVTGKSESQMIRELPQAITVIDTKEIEGRVVTVTSLLNKAVGIKIRQSGGEGSDTRVSVRGLEGKRIGFYINDFPMSENSDFVDVDDIPVTMIERIEVYKGVVPAKFGGSSIGGAVNIVLKEYPPTYVDLSYSRESFNTNKVAVVLKKNDLESGYEFGGGGFYTYAQNDYEMDSPYVPGLSMVRDHDEYEKLTIALGFTSKVWWFDEIEFEPVYIRQSQEIQGIQVNTRFAETSLEAFLIANKYKKEHFLLQDLNLEYTQGYGYSISKYIDTASYRTSWGGAIEDPVSEYGGELGYTANNSKNKKHTYTNRLNLNYPINNNHGINFNSVFRYADFNPKDDLQELVLGYKTNYKSNSNSLVAGVTHEFKTKNDIFLNSFSLKYYTFSVNTKIADFYGLKPVEKIDNTKNDFGFNNASRYRLTGDFLLKASFAWDLRLPAEEELIGNGYAIIPAGDLLPERNLSFNFGAMLDHSISRDSRLQVEVNLFYMYLEDMIRLTPSTVFGARYRNFGEMRGLGADIEIKYDVNRYFYLYSNATYQDLRDARELSPGTQNENPTKDDRMPNIPYFYANAGIEFHKENLFGGSGHNSRLYLDCSFVEEYFYDFEQSEFQENRIPQSLSFDVGFEHSMYNDSFIITTQISNLTDQTIISEFNHPLPGRSFGMKVRYLFK